MDGDVRTRVEEEIHAERLRKKGVLEAHELPSYPTVSNRTHTLVEVRDTFDELESSVTSVTIAGRVMAVRTHGGSAFLDVFDGTASIQLYLKEDVLGTESFALAGDTIDRGDFVEVTGVPMRTKRGELSVQVKAWHMLAKSMNAIPTEHFGIKDEEARYRKRYLDILLDREVADRIRRRSVFWNAARSFLLAREFVEVETPVLETTPGGAEARPFVTHHNALDIDVHLRISAGELWQKKLLVAGLPKTFEIGRIFRNEGMSHEHLQDYTQLEFYEAYSDYEKGKVLVRELYRHLAQTTYGKLTFTMGTFEVDLGKDWVEYDFCALMQDAYGFDPRDVTEEDAVAAVKEAGLAGADGDLMNKERAVDTLWKKIRKGLGGPGYLVNVPVYLEPLAKRSETDERVVERFQVMLAGSEMGKGFSELNDPIDQRARFMRQEEMREAGDDEAQQADLEFVEALEYGMPPAFGFGVSERLFSFFENVSAREAQIFPLLRPKSGQSSESGA